MIKSEGDRRKSRDVGVIDETKKKIRRSKEIIVGRLGGRMKLRKKERDK